MSNIAVFLDRDNTLIEDPGYINYPDQVKLLDGVPEVLIELKAIDYKLIVVSNQSAVARGIITEKVLGEIHDRLKQLLAEKGAYLNQIYYCPYHPDGVIPKYRKASDCRKPNPGMLLNAAKEMDIDLSQSWMIGNSECDIEAGSRAGCKTILVNRSLHHKQPISSSSSAETNPDYTAVNLKEAVNIIKKYRRSSGEKRAPSHSVPIYQTESVSQAVKQLPQSEPVETQTQTEQLLINILEQLRSMQRANMFSEFSIMRLMAGIVQIMVLFCLLITVWFLMSPSRQDNSVFIALGFAAVLQMMSLSFYMMQRRK